MLEIPESWDTCQRKPTTETGTSSRERRGLQSRKLKGIGGLKSVLTSDMAMQSLEFSQLVSSLVLAQYFPTMLFSLPFGKVMYILCHCML